MSTATPNGWRQWSGEKLRQLQECGENLKLSAGKRYLEATRESFELWGDADQQQRQQRVLDKLTDFCLNMESITARGGGLVFFGDPGTGKDHLMVACLKEAIRDNGFICVYRNMLDIIDEQLQDIGKGWGDADVILKCIAPDILAISDPIPIGRDLTDTQRSLLARIVERRCKNLKPTWITVNAKNSAQFEGHLGPAIASRFRDASTQLKCDWGDYRSRKI